MAVAETETVEQTRAGFHKAYQAHEKLKQQIIELDRVCTPSYDTSSSPIDRPNRLQVEHAQLALLALHLRWVETEMAIEKAQEAHHLATR